MDRASSFCYNEDQSAFRLHFEIMHFALIQQRLLALPEIAQWADLRALLERPVRQRATSVWEYPTLACQAVGGAPEAAFPAVTAVFASLLAIHLVDDMLDDDPRGLYRRLGAGTAANLALALQAAGHRELDQAPVAAGTRALLNGSLARMAFATAYGQSLDSREVTDEAEYWQVVGAKTPPLFGSAFFLGAVLGGADVGLAESLEQVGGVLGRLVQVSDDLGDAMQEPASADWQRPGNNLALLYALVSDHDEREPFRRAAAAAHDPACLSEAQQILLRCGAVSYCAYRLLELADQARSLLSRLPLADPLPLSRLVDEHLRPLSQLLRAAGAELPEHRAAS